MNYLLDTNICIAVINETPAPVRVRLRKALASGAEVFVSSPVIFELWYGVFKSARPEFNTRRLETFLAGPIGQIAFEEEDARIAGSIRAGLEAAGKPIGAYDVLIAAQAMRHGMTLVTANVSEFSRVKNLLWLDWAKA